MGEEVRTVAQRRRDALGQDALLFCAAFTAGAAAYALVRIVLQAVGRGSGDLWTIGLSQDLVLTGLLAGELFLVWNNGYRQGVRGHSIGKHRLGLRVVDRQGDRPLGAARGVLRGVVMAVLLDLAAAAIPIGLPTALRRLTPESWHVGGAAYLALLLLLVPLLVRTDRGFADVVAGSRVVAATGADATTAPERRRALVALDVAGVVGVLALALTYVAYFSPLLRFPSLF
jgi:uncharacterized RDD family membrane protein YckC